METATAGQFGNYAIIYWLTYASIGETPGNVYGWYEQLGTALNTVADLNRQHKFAHAVVVKAV